MGSNGRIGRKLGYHRSASRLLAHGGLTLLGVAFAMAACGNDKPTGSVASGARSGAGQGSGDTPEAGASPGDATGTAGRDFGGRNGSGGSSGSGGSAGSGGSNAAGSTGTAGGGHAGASTVSGGKLGRACINDVDCRAPADTALKCITATSTELGPGAPPKGLCTAACATDDDCSAHGPGAICYPFSDQASYCIEACQFGQPALGEAKCHNRAEFACNPALLGATNSPCDQSTDCQDGELCLNGACNVVFPGCLPACRGDIDCANGMYCDQSFLSGVCITTKPTGKRLGEPCTVPAANLPAEPDGCLGFCQADDASNSGKGHCAATCGLGTQCAWDPASQRFDGACFTASVLTDINADTGDFGYCTSSCNCSEECHDPVLSCQLLAQGALSADFKGEGLCFAPALGSIPHEACGSAGAGGASGTAGAGGAQ